MKSHLPRSGLFKFFCDESDTRQDKRIERERMSDMKAASLVAEMTDEEKFSWLSGPIAVPFNGKPKPNGAIGSAGFFPAIHRLGIPSQQQSDASLGISNLGNVRPGDNATALPSSLLLGATFDVEIAFISGYLVGSEAKAKGFNVQLAGGANLIREPRGGRNFEYISEDPLLTGVIAGNSIDGIQAKKVASTVKHFAMNTQETGRVMANSVLNEAAMRESDLLAFQIAIEIGRPAAVMTGYNLVNGDYTSENEFLISKVLKGDWHYPGWVMSDWGAVHSTEKAIMAGTDAQSGANLDPEIFFGSPLRKAVEQGRVPQQRIDDAVHRQLRSLIAVGVIGNHSKQDNEEEIDYTKHKYIAQKIAEAGIILLKNEKQFLPFHKGIDKILVVGSNADIGVLAGGGSSAVSPIGSNFSEGVQFGDIEMPKVHQPSSPLNSIKTESGAHKVVFNTGENQEDVVREAKEASVVIFYAEEWRSEGRDAQGLSLPDNQDSLIAALARANANIVVILQTGGPVVMPWLNDVKAVISCFYPGTGGADAIAGVLFGRVNPSGRLPITFPACETQLPIPEQVDPDATTSMPGQPTKGEILNICYDLEGSDCGYRWYNREKLNPLFPFGFGLSYTSFEYQDFEVDTSDGNITALVTVTNTGTRSGADVIQLFIAHAGKYGFVPRLAGFQKVFLEIGESKTIKIKSERRLSARFDSTDNLWVIEGGQYDVSIARNANSLIRTISLDISPSKFAP